MELDQIKVDAERMKAASIDTLVLAYDGMMMIKLSGADQRSGYGVDEGLEAVRAELKTRSSDDLVAYFLAEDIFQ